MLPASEHFKLHVRRRYDVHVKLSFSGKFREMAMAKRRICSGRRGKFEYLELCHRCVIGTVSGHLTVGSCQLRCAMISRQSSAIPYHDRGSVGSLNLR